MPDFRRYRVGFVIIITGALCFFPFHKPPAINAQEPPPPPEEKVTKPPELPPPDPKLATTTENPSIPVEELEFLVKPLTLEELHNEAAAWLLLVKAKTKEISNAEIAVKRQNLSIDKQKEATAALEAAQTALTEAEKAQANAKPGTPEMEEANKKVEKAKTDLAKAQEAVKESAAAKEDTKDDKTLTTALKDSKKESELEDSKKVLEQAKQDRDKLTAGSPAQAEATKKIDELEKAITDLEEAKKAQDATLPDSPEFKEAAKKVEAAHQVMLKARSAIDGKSTTTTPNQSDKKVDEAASDLEKTDINASPGEGNTTEKDKLDQTINKLEQSTEVDTGVKQDLLVNVTTLQADQTALIDRLNVVLKAITTKGGDIESQEKYIQAITAVKIDTKDTEGALIRITSWFQSEQGGVRWAINIGKFVGIVAASVVVSQILGMILMLGLGKVKGTSSLLRQFIVMLVKRGGFLVGILLALTALEVSLGPILAVLGGASFVLAFALQSNLGNFASGLMLLVYKPFDVGDEVIIGDIWGWVDSITLASTKIKGWKAQIYTIPNNSVWSSTIENLTLNENRRGVITIGVTYETDLRKVQKILLDIAKAHPQVLDEPAPLAFLWAYSEQTIDFKFGFWTKKEDFWNVWEQIHFQIMDRFPEENIAIPWPHQHIHLHQESLASAGLSPQLPEAKFPTSS